MAIVGRWFGEVISPGGDGATSATVYLHFPAPISVSAQVAMNGMGAGGSGGVVEVGISGIAQNFGPMQPLGSPGSYGSYAHVLFQDQVTDVWLTARSFSAYVAGSVVLYQWD